MTTEQLCQCLTCGRMHHALGFGPPRLTDDEKRIKAIQERVRPTIGPTYSSRGETIEGRISKADFDTLTASWLAWKFTASCSQAWADATPEQRANIEADVKGEIMRDYAEMLAALKDCLPEMFGSNMSDADLLWEQKQGNEMVVPVMRARAAIAKAEGRT